MLDVSSLRGSTPRVAVESSPDELTSVEPSRPKAGVVAATTLAVIASVWFLSWAKGVLIPLSFAVFLAICLTPAVRFLARLRIPCSVGAALVLIAVSGAIGFAVNYSRDDAVHIVDQMPAAARYLRREINTAVNDPGSMAHRLKVLMDLQHASEPLPIRNAPAAAAAPVATDFGDDTRQVFALTSELAAVLFLVYLMLATNGRLQRRISNLEGLPDHWRAGAKSMFVRIERSLYHYLGVLIFTNALVGVAVWGVFRLFGIHYAGVWGIAAGVLHFVPYVGPALIAIGSGLYALMQLDSLPQALLVAASTLAVSSLIGVVLQTWLLGRSAGMNIVAVFVSLIFWSWIWGLPGLLLGTPITMTLKMVCGKVPSLQWVDGLLDGGGRQRQVVARRIILRTVLRVDPN